MNVFSDDSSMVERSLFQMEDGGSIPTSSLQIANYSVHKCEWKSLTRLLARYHYRKDSIGGSIKVCLGVWCEGEIIGGAVLGNPWHPETYAENGKYRPIELRRLVFIDDAPKNSESWLIGKVGWWLRKYTSYNRILSYSDLGKGHTGVIYKAAGFTCLGETAVGSSVRFEGREFHMRSLSIDRDYARELSEAVKSGNAVVADTGRKIIWIRDIAQPIANPIPFFRPLEDTHQSQLFGGI